MKTKKFQSNLKQNNPCTPSITNFPKNGIVDKRFVITVAPHNLIWPHGKTCTIKVIIVNIINQPEIQVSFKLKNEQNNTFK